MHDTDRILIDFAAPNEGEQWFAVNDGVMGGLSQGQMDIVADGRALFHGRLSLENNGGFASSRRRPRTYDLAGFEGVAFQVKGDGGRYQFRIRMGDKFDEIAYRAEFATVAGKWLEVIIPFTQFEPSFHGRLVEGAPKLDPERIRQVGFLIADRRPGIFHLEIGRVRAYRGSGAGG